MNSLSRSSRFSILLSLQFLSFALRNSGQWFYSSIFLYNFLRSHQSLIYWVVNLDLSFIFNNCYFAKFY